MKIHISVYWSIWMWAYISLAAPTFDLKAFGDGIALVDNLFQLQRNAASLQSIIAKTTDATSSKKNNQVSTVTVFQKENNLSDQLNQLIEALNRDQNTGPNSFNFTGTSSILSTGILNTQSSSSQYMESSSSHSKSRIIVVTTVLSP